MVKAVIFDCFGVLATEAWLPFKAKYFSHDPKLYEQATDIGRQANRGLISYDDFIGSIARLAGISPRQAASAIQRNVPNERLFAYIEGLKPKYKLGLLSNAAADRLQQIFTENELADFDAITLSYQKGFIKPQSEAFEVAARELGVTPEECVFVDDQQRHIDGALAAGMRGILYTDFEHFEPELDKLLRQS